MSLFLYRLRFHCVFCCALVFLATPVFALPSNVEIKIDGVKGKKLQNIEAAIGLPSGIVHDDQVDKRWLLRFIGQIPALAEKALQPFGYYRSEIKTDLQERDKDYLIHVQVTPGVPVRVRQLDLRMIGAGSDKPALRAEFRRFPLKQEDILRHESYDEWKKGMQRKAVNLGYLKAAYTARQVTVYPDEDAADIDLELDTGELYRFGHVNFINDLDYFDETFLRRFIAFAEGDVFSHRELHRSRINFYQSNRFSEVLIVPRLDQAEGHNVPIDVNLVVGPQYCLRPGIGYGTNTGARLSLKHRNIHPFDRSDLYKLEFLLAEKTEFMKTSYSIPQAGSSENNLVTTLEIRHEDIDVYENTLAYAELEQTYKLGFGKTGAIYLRYSREDSDIGTEDFVTYLLTPGIRYFQRRYDNPLNPKKGYQFRLELRGNHDNVLSDVSFAQILGAGSFVLPLSERFLLHTRVEAATTIKNDDFKDIPASMRFFVGGDSSVRGYAYKSRGPRDKNNDVIGGDSMLVGSAEIEYSLNDNWGLAVFYDTGSAFNNDGDDINFVSGAGIGVRRYTLVGPLKLDLARRVDDSDHDLRFHLSFGFDI